MSAAARCGLFWRAVLMSAAVVLIVAQSQVKAQAQAEVQVEVEEKGLVRTDSRTPYVHLIPLYDADDNMIDPSDSAALPYSPAVTCGKCHAVDTINHGWHFNAVSQRDSKTPDVRPGEPWVYYDPQTRTQAPLSYRDWPGLHHPQAFGLSQWDFTRLFGRHFPGAGPGLPPVDSGDSAAGEANEMGDESEIEDDPFGPDLASLPGRWHITGPLENDCMICHSASRNYDVGEWARQVESENFKWAPTAALGVATVKGDTKSIPQEFDPLLFDPILGAAPGVEFPIVEYDARRFDAGQRVRLDVVRQPPTERCYYCHTTTRVDEQSGPAWAHDQDIHMRAGMNCADCHRHGLDHEIIRGYPGESKVTGKTQAATLSCQGCHLGGEADFSHSDDPLLLGGKLGAPIPEHHGLPPIHFKVLSCTACHSGPWPGNSPERIQTAMAHALGLASEHRTDKDPPYVIEPVFVRNDDGVIEPRRMVWPAYWGSMADDVVTPLDVETLGEVVEPVLGIEREEQYKLPGGWKPLTTDEIMKALKSLADHVPDEARAVYVAGGLVHRLEGEGDSATLKTIEHEVAAPYSWAMAHDVRGAGQSLGVRGCADCHAADSPMVAGSFDAGPVSPVKMMTTTQLETEQYDPTLAEVWALSFQGRTLLKLFGFACCGIVLLVILRHVPAALAGDEG